MNVALALAHLGVCARLVAGAAPDAEALRATLAALGIEATFSLRPEAHRSWIVKEPQAVRIYFNEGAPPPFEAALEAAPSLLVTSGFDLLSDPSGYGALLDQAERSGIPVAFDAGPASADPTLLAPLLPRFSALFVNEDEGSALTGESEPEAMLAAIPGREVHLKLGTRGSWVRVTGRVYKGDPVAVATPDPIGAGDAYLAGALADVGADPTTRILEANRSGAWAAARPGAGTDWLPL